MYIENRVNCRDTQNGQSAAKPGNWNVQRLSRKGVGSSDPKRMATLWVEEIVSPAGLNR